MSYVQNTDQDRKEMLAVIGVESIEELLAPIPKQLRVSGELAWPQALTELELDAHLRELADRNTAATSCPSFLGAGAYDHYVPAVVEHLANRSEFVNSYTQYQAEASQGYLQALFEYQSMICALTGLDVANASLYDAATALAEAILMARADTGRSRAVVSRGVHPEYLQTLETYFLHAGITLDLLELDGDGATTPDALEAKLGDDVCAVVFQTPTFLGQIEDAAALAERGRAAGARVVAICDPISLAVLAPPGDFGADIAVMEGQCLGTPPYFGGPGLGIIATHKKLVRKLAGRIVGRTVDKDGKPGYVLTLQTREQHIRREKATSNICTNQAYIALRACVYLSSLGPRGLSEVAGLCIQKAHYLARRIAEVPDFALRNAGRPFFKEFAVECPTDAAKVADAMRRHGIEAGVPLGRFDPALQNVLLVAVTERRTRAEMDAYVTALREVRTELSAAEPAVNHA